MNQPDPRPAGRKAVRDVNNVNVDAFVEATKEIDPDTLARELDRQVRRSEDEHRMSRQAAERVIRI